MTEDSPEKSTDMAYFGRVCRGEHYSGDLVFIHEQKGRIFIAVVDAAGHGHSAHQIANKVETILRSKDTDDLAALVVLLHDQLKGSSGAVIIVGALETENMVFDFIQMGDTHGKIFGPGRRTLVGQAGMLGQAIRTPIVRSETLSEGELLVLCTDGVSERYDLDDIRGYRNLSADALARQIVGQFGKDHDDATCLVVRNL